MNTDGSDMQEMQICYCGNRTVFPQLLLSVLSVIKHTARPVRVFVFTMDLTDIRRDFVAVSQRQCEILDSVLREKNENSGAVLVDVGNEYRQYLMGGKNQKSMYTPYAQLRLIFDKCDLPDKLIYLDTDTMCCGDIGKLWDTDIENYEFGAVKDVEGSFWINKNYCNSGVLLLNMAECKRTGLLERVREYIRYHHLIMPDQSALNKLATKKLILPRAFNEQRDIREDTVIKHFCAGWRLWPYFKLYNYKQTDRKSVREKLRIHCFDDIYSVYDGLQKKYGFGLKNGGQSDYALRIEDLRKSYGDVHAVNGISFDVKKGSMFAFLGVNGAGKSTTINIICSILEKDSGKVYVGDMDIDKDAAEIKRHIGIVFQTSVLDKELTVLQNLEIRTAFYGLSKAEQRENIRKIIELLELGPILKRPVKNLSGGQMRRVDIARAMVHRPDLLILDEPTTGLDPKNRRIVWSLIDKIREETGMTVFLTTHYLEEAELATDVVIMDRGEIIAHGTPNELKNKYSSDALICYTAEDGQFSEALKKGGYEFRYDEEKAAYRIKIPDTAAAKEIMQKFPLYTSDVEIVKGRMDDVFLNVTGRDIGQTEDKDEGRAKD